MLSEESQPARRDTSRPDTRTLAQTAAAGPVGTILVVDDDTAWLANLERWLAADGFRVIGMSRGEWIVQSDWTSSGSCIGDNPTFPSSS